MKLAIGLALLFVSATAVTAQTHDMSAMAPQPVMIDGSVTPQAIPDIVAYRTAFFILAEPRASDGTHSAAHIDLMSHLGLLPDDQSQMDLILEDFYAKAQALIVPYNAAATAANAKGVAPAEEPQFWKDLAALVTTTQQKVNLSLTSAGSLAFSGRVQASKATLHVPASDPMVVAAQAAPAQ